MPFEVYNVMTDQRVTFNDDTIAPLAVATAFCAQVGRAAWLQEKIARSGLYAALSELDIVIGERSIACGDWFTRERSGLFYPCGLDLHGCRVNQPLTKRPMLYEDAYLYVRTRRYPQWLKGDAIAQPASMIEGKRS